MSKSTKAVKTVQPEIVSATTPTALSDELSNLPTKSARIRHLNAQGMTRSQIAKALNIKYQFVRNVLTQQPPKATQDVVSAQ